MTVAASGWRRRACGLAAAAVTGALLTLPVSTADAASTGLVVNEVYGGGGNSGAPYTNDFIELKNVGGSAIDLSGWKVEYLSASGGSGGSTALSGSLPAGKTFLIQEGAGSTPSTPLPDPDATGALNMSASNGSVRLIDASGATVDLVGYGSATLKETTATRAPSNTTSAARANDTDTDDNSADFVVGAPTPQGSGGGTTPPADPSKVCGDPASLIHDVQGAGDTSPMVDQAVAVEGRVTGVKPGFNGYFVQEESSDADANDQTSEGVFVYDSTNHPSVNDHVRVVGKVSEFNGLTEITTSAFSDCGTLPAEDPVDLTLPQDTLEPYEGMDVRLADELVVSEYYNYSRYGEIVLGKPLDGEDRLWQPTQVVAPGPEAVALAEEYAKRQIVVDDNSSAQNPASLPNPENGEPFSLSNSFRGGDRVQGTSGNLTYSFGDYKLEPNAYGTVTHRNERTAQPESPEGTNLRVASANVLNYFVTIDDGKPHCGPDGSMECRGADTPEEFDRQQAKIVSEIGEMDADVVGLMEIENTQGVDAVQNLVDALNATYGANTYAAVDTGVLGGDAIKVGLIYQPSAVEPKGDYDVLDSSDDPRFLDDKNRVLLTQSFTEKSTGGVISVSVAHLKSKGSDCEDVGDPDAGDGQGNCNQTRTDAVHAITDHLAGDPTGSGDPDHLVLGDMNAYGNEDPITAYEDAGYTDLAKSFHGDHNYSYVFDGLVGSLDHALTTEPLTGQVLATDEWHNNADEPSVIDYDMTFKPDPIDALFAPDSYRASDHDPLVVSLQVTGDAEPEPTTSQTTAAADPARVDYGSATTISGAVTDTNDDPVAGADVTLQQAPVGTRSWTDAGTTTTGDDGGYAFDVTPRRNTRYRVVFAGTGTMEGSTSKPVRVNVTPVVRMVGPATVRVGKQIKLNGSVAPQDRQTVQLQIRTADGWTTVDESRSRPHGTFKLSWTSSRSDAPGRRVFRAVVPATDELVQGTSDNHVVQVVY